MLFEPLHDKVLVRQKEANEKIGQIYIPEQAQQRITEGEVLAVGPGHPTSDGGIRPLSVNVGDRILYARYGGTTITVGNEENLVILAERDIHGRLHDQEEPQ